jgi:hypothetical protein
MTASACGAFNRSAIQALQTPGVENQTPIAPEEIIEDVEDTNDVTAPVLSSLTSSEGTRVVASNYTSYPVSGNCTPGDGPVALTIGGSAVGTATCSGGGTFATTLNMSSISNGADTLTASQTDAASNTGSTTLAITVDYGVCSGSNATGGAGGFAVGSIAGEGGTYIICTSSQLTLITAVLSATSSVRFDLRNHLDGAGSSLIPIGGGVVSSYWQGASPSVRDEFNGNGLSIRNLVLTPVDDHETSVGFFRKISGHAYIHDLTLSNISLWNGTNGDDQGVAIGILAGSAGENARIESISIRDSTVNDTESGTLYASRGGLIGTVGEGSAANPWEAGGCEAGFLVSGITISGITINKPTINHVGGAVGKTRVGPCTMTQITVSGSVSGAASVGGVIGKIEDASTDASHLSFQAGSVQGTEAVGGVIGHVERAGTLSNLRSAGSITVGPTAYKVGGAIGNLTAGTLNRASSSMTVTGGNEKVGGLLGEIRPTYGDVVITESFSTGSVTAATAAIGVGGFAGYLEPVASYDLTISDSFSRSTVAISGGSASHQVGGFAGTVGIGALSSLITLQRIYASGAVTGGATNHGFSPSSISDDGNYIHQATFYDATKNPTSAKGTARTTAQMQDALDYASVYTESPHSFDFSSSGVWSWDTAANLPRLKWSAP